MEMNSEELWVVKEKSYLGMFIQGKVNTFLWMMVQVQFNKTAFMRADTFGLWLRCSTWRKTPKHKVIERIDPSDALHIIMLHCDLSLK